MSEREEGIIILIACIDDDISTGAGGMVEDGERNGIWLRKKEAGGWKDDDAPLWEGEGLLVERWKLELTPMRG